MDLNQEVIINTYKNANIGLQSISDVLPETTCEAMQKELQNEYEGYEKIIGEISEYMSNHGIEPKDVNVFKKAMLWTSIKMNTLTDDTCSHIADMMLKGTIMGISELLQILSRSDGKLESEVKELVEKLLNLEESYEENLKKLL